MEDIESEINS